MDVSFARFCEGVGTHVVDRIARVATKSKEGTRTERERVAVEGLDGGHQDRRGQETDPFLVEDGEGPGAKVENNAGSDTEGEKEGGECWRGG